MADQTSETTVIGKGTTIKGEMEFEGGARVLGVFEGRIQAGGELQVDHGATCRAELSATRITVDGQVEGNVKAIDQLTLTANARVTGDVTAGTLVVTEGAQFNGHVSVGPDAIKNATTTRPAVASTVEPRGHASWHTTTTRARNEHTNETSGNGELLAGAGSRLEADD